MNIKKIVSIFLLLFIVVSVGTIVAKEIVLKTVVEVQNESQVTQQTVQQTEPQKQAKTSTAVKVVAYYFYGNYRCSTCRKIEFLTTEAIETGFVEEIKNGSVELKTINVEEPYNKHYIQDYQLASRSVVVARYEGKNQKDWKRLDAVWQLTEDKEAFISLVQDETTALLKGKN